MKPLLLNRRASNTFQGDISCLTSAFTVRNNDMSTLIIVLLFAAPRTSCGCPRCPGPGRGAARTPSPSTARSLAPPASSRSRPRQCYSSQNGPRHMTQFVVNSNIHDGIFHSYLGDQGNGALSPPKCMKQLLSCLQQSYISFTKAKFEM